MLNLINLENIVKINNKTYNKKLSKRINRLDYAKFIKLFRLNKLYMGTDNFFYLDSNFYAYPLDSHKFKITGFYKSDDNSLKLILEYKTHKIKILFEDNGKYDFYYKRQTNMAMPLAYYHENILELQNGVYLMYYLDKDQDNLYYVDTNGLDTIIYKINKYTSDRKEILKAEKAKYFLEKHSKTIENLKKQLLKMKLEDYK